MAFSDSTKQKNLVRLKLLPPAAYFNLNIFVVYCVKLNPS